MQQPRLTIEQINAALKKQGCKTFDKILEVMPASHEQEPTMYVVSKTHRIKMKTVRETNLGSLFAGTKKCQLNTKIPLAGCEKLLSGIIYVSKIEIKGVDILYLRFLNHERIFDVHWSCVLTGDKNTGDPMRYWLHNLAMLDFDSTDFVCKEKLPVEVELIVEETNVVLHHPEWDPFLQYK